MEKDINRLQQIIALLNEGVSADIWYDASEHNDQEAAYRIDAVQNAMTEAAFLLSAMLPEPETVSSETEAEAAVETGTAMPLIDIFFPEDEFDNRDLFYKLKALDDRFSDQSWKDDECPHLAILDDNSGRSLNLYVSASTAYWNESEYRQQYYRGTYGGDEVKAFIFVSLSDTDGYPIEKEDFYIDVDAQTYESLAETITNIVREKVNW